MEAVSKELKTLILELQSFKSLESFALAGGTSLAIRFNHRISVDLDFFTNIVIGESGLEAINKELKDFYKDSLKFCEIINTESGNQYCFLRLNIAKDGKSIKVEFIQNIQSLEPYEVYNKIKLFTIRDIALFKLMSATNRKANKDIYDLDLITDNIDLGELLLQLEVKFQKFNNEENKCLFDLDDEISPVDNPLLLLEFDNINYLELPSRPSHSNDRIDIITGNKEWKTAKSSWRRKVRDLVRNKGISLPPVQPIN